MISAGAPAGTTTTNHDSPATSGYPASVMVGTSGKACDRDLVVTASARSVPSRTMGTAGAIEPNEVGVCPATAEAIARPPPLNGMCTRSSPREIRNNSPTR